MSRVARLPFFVLMPLLAALVVPARALAQKATSVAKASIDLDGDGHSDELRIDEMGNISVHLSGSKDAGASTTLQAIGKVVDGSVQVSPDRDTKGRHIVVIKAVLRSPQSRRREEGLVLAYEPGKLTQLWR